MKALSVRQPWLSMICAGEKTIETMTWFTRYRGRVLLVASLAAAPGLGARSLGLPRGVAMAYATVSACRPMIKADEAAAKCAVYKDAMAWCLTDVRVIAKPFPVTGALGLFNVDHEEIR